MYGLLARRSRNFVDRYSDRSVLSAQLLRQEDRANHLQESVMSGRSARTFPLIAALVMTVFVAACHKKPVATPPPPPPPPAPAPVQPAPPPAPTPPPPPPPVAPPPAPAVDPITLMSPDEAT